MAAKSNAFKFKDKLLQEFLNIDLHLLIKYYLGY